MPASTDAASHAPSDSASSRAPLVAAHIPPATRTFTGTATLRAFHTDLIERKTSDIHRKGHTATLLRDGKVLIVGGYDEWSGSSGDDWTTHANAELYNPVTGVFSTTTSLAESRTFHTATLLPDGTVLVAGGYSAQPFNVRATAELYQPTKGTWVRSTNMAKPRAEHTATLLTNGKVLVVGGRSQGTVLSDAELYDPATGKWTSTGRMNVARSAHTATLLRDGTVLVTGGDGLNASIHASAEIYNPANGRWTPIDGMEHERDYHTATRLHDGRVLIVGGNGEGYESQYSAEVFDPVIRRWQSVEGMATERVAHTATLLANGLVLIVGGMRADPRSELYDPATGIWTSAGYMSNAHWEHTATPTRDGKVVVFGGETSAYSPYYPEIYDPATGAWTANTEPPRRPSNHTATLLRNGKVLLAGGFASYGYGLSNADIYDPATGIITGTGSLQESRSDHTATLLGNGNVLITGGHSDSWNNFSGRASAEVYNPATGTFALAGSMAEGRYRHTETLLRNGKVLVTGGFGDRTALASAELYDPATNTWTRTGNMREARGEHTATLLPNGKVLIAGGAPGIDREHFSLASAELYDPATGTFSSIGDMGHPRHDHTATVLLDGTVLLAGGFSITEPFYDVNPDIQVYDPVTSTFTYVEAYMERRASHTATLLTDGSVLFTGGYTNVTNGMPERSQIYDPNSKRVRDAGYSTQPRYFHTTTLMPDGSILIYGGYPAKNGQDVPQTELGRFVPTNTVTGTLTLPTGWITTTTTISFTGKSSTNPLIDGGAIDSEWPVPAEPGKVVTTTYTPKAQGVGVPVTLHLRVVGGNEAAVVTGHVDVDSVAPTSKMEALHTSANGSITLRWQGEDATSGVASYDVEVRESGSEAWKPLAQATTARSATFLGTEGRRYAVRVRARDVAGNVEAWRMTVVAPRPERFEVFLPNIRR
jgi:N-acetylneuraminic acid mutarotase